MDVPFDLDALVEEAALELVHKHKIDEIHAALRARGVTQEAAERLAQFIPSAFAREHFEREGVEFPRYFLTGPAEHHVERPYEGEPFYAAARSLARCWIAESRMPLVMRVLDWSAEADTIKEAKRQGLTPARMFVVHYSFSSDSEPVKRQATRAPVLERILYAVMTALALLLILAAVRGAFHPGPG